MTYARGNPAHWWKPPSWGLPSRAPSTLAVGPFRRFISLSFLALLILLIFSVWYVTNPTRVGRLAENLLSNVFGGKVTVKHAHLSFSGTLLLSGVELQTNTSPNSPHPLPVFSAEQIEARFDWLSLLSGNLTATQLIALNPTLFLIEDPAANRWNYERLHAAPSSNDNNPSYSAAAPARSPALPVIILRSASIQWAEVIPATSNGAPARIEPTATTIVDAQLIPEPNSPSTYRFQITRHGNESPGLADITTRSASGSGGGGASSTPSDILVTGSWDVAQNRFTAATDKIILSNNLKVALPRNVRKWWDDHHLKGQLSQFRLTFDPDDGLVLFVELDNVSFLQQVQPNPAGGDAPPETFPVPISNLRGPVRFGITKPNLRVANLRGRVMTFPFAVDADLRGLSPESPFDLTVRFQNAHLDRPYPPLFIATLPVQELLQRVAPWGDFDLNVSVKRLSWNGGLFLDGNITCKDGHMRFVHFPYPLDHVNGKIHFNNQLVQFINVTAMGDETNVTINGSAGAVHSLPLVDFLVTSNNATFDARMAACLPEKFQNVWNQFSLRAHGSFVCKVERPMTADPDAEPTSHVSVTLDDGKGYLKLLPYPLTHAKGKITFTGDQTQIQNLSVHSGIDGSGKLTFNGAINHPGGDITHLRPDLRLTADIPIDRALLATLPDTYAAKLQDIDLTGRLGFDGNIKDNPDPNAPIPANITGDITLKSATLTWYAPTQDSGLRTQNLTLTNLAAEAHLATTSLTLKQITALTAEGINLTASGTVDLSTNSALLHLAANAKDLTLPPTPPALLPETARTLWTTYNPSGTLDLQATATLQIPASPTSTATVRERPETAPAQEASSVTTNQNLPNYQITKSPDIKDFSLTLSPKSLILTAAHFPEPFHDISGTITANPQKVTFENLKAVTGPATLNLRGSYDIDTGKIHLEGTADADAFPEKWYAKLSPGFASFLDTNKPTGSLQLQLNTLDRPAADKPWDFSATLSFNKLATNGPPTSISIAADKLSLNLTKASYDVVTGLNIVSGVLAGADLSISNKPIDSLAATITSIPAEKSITFSDIDGKVAGGSLRGSITAQFQENPGYRGDLTLADADLASLALPKNATDEERKKIGTGKVTATLALQQTFGDANGKGADRTGRGDLVVRDGKMYNVPLSMGLMQIATLRLPVSRSFESASMTYYIRDNKVTFEKILLASPGINLAGSGVVSIKNLPPTLELNFVTESADNFRIPFLTEIWRGTQYQLLQIAVTGPIDNPKITPVPLNPLLSPLQALLPHKTPRPD